MIKKWVITGQELGHSPVLLLMLKFSSSVVNGGKERIDWLLEEERKLCGKTAGIFIPGSKEAEVGYTSSNLLEFGWQNGYQVTG